jgi:diguanylate cyclase (GGDEF)-like protein
MPGVRRAHGQMPSVPPDPRERADTRTREIGAAAPADGRSRGRAAPSAWCTALFYALFAAVAGASTLARSSWQNPLVMVFIIALTVWSRSHSVKVTSSESEEDSHAFSLNGVCILAVAALNGTVPAVLAASASELAPFLSPRFHHARRRSTVSDLACNLASAGVFALLAGVALSSAAAGLGRGAAFLAIVFAVSIVADFLSMPLVAAYNRLGFRQSGSHGLMPYLVTWSTLFPALALSTAVLVVTLWVDRTSGPAAFSFAVLTLVSVQSLLARVARVEFALRQERDKVSWLAHHDGLTGLWNRLALDDQLAAVTARSPADQTALLFLDLDRFKQINDTYGHVAGDELLRAVAERLVGSLREHDRVFRQGGDEFLIVARIDGDDDLAHVVRRAGAIFDEPFSVGDSTLAVTGSLGVARWPQDADSGEELLHLADSRMYERKADEAPKEPQPAGARAQALP